MQLPQPALYFDFSRARRLDPRLSFNRSSEATRQDHNGRVQYAPEDVPRFDFKRGVCNGLLIEPVGINLFNFSERFDNPYWTKTQAVVVPGISDSPDGAITSNEITCLSSGNGNGAVSRDITGMGFLGGQVAAISFFCKRINSRWLCASAAMTNGIYCRVWFDIELGLLGGIDTIEGFESGIKHEIEAVGGGWFRCSLIIDPQDESLASIFSIHPSSDDLLIDAIEGQKYQLWGAQIEKSAVVTSYIPSLVSFVSRSTPGFYHDSVTSSVAITSTNFLTQSNGFNDESWVIENAKVVSNISISPEGKQEGFKFVETIAYTEEPEPVEPPPDPPPEPFIPEPIASEHKITKTVEGLVIGQTYTLSIHVRKGERNHFKFGVINSETDFATAVFNINDRVFSNAEASLSMNNVDYGFYDVDAGWTRIHLMFVATAQTYNVLFGLYNSESTYIGTDNFGIYLYGAQLNLRSIHDYLPTTLSAILSGAIRPHYNPYSRINRGVLFEPETSNLLTHSEQFENAYWSKSNFSVSSDLVAAPDRTRTARRLTDDATNGVHAITRSISVSNGLNYTFSVYIKPESIKRVALGYTGASFASDIGIFDTETEDQHGDIGLRIDRLSNGWYRVSRTDKALSSGTVTVRIMAVDESNNIVYSGVGSSVLIWGAQFEQNNMLTSIIPTFGSINTRGADVVTGGNGSRSKDICRLDIGPWFNADEATIYLGYKKTSGNIGAALGLSGVNSELLLNGSVDLVSLKYSVIGQDVFLLTRDEITEDDIKTAISFKSLANTLSVNGSVPNTNNIQTVNAQLFDRMTIGSDRSGNNQLNATISRLIYFPLHISPQDASVLSSVPL